MPLAVVGANHRTAPIELRERLALGRAELADALRTLAGDDGEAVVLSTCNRTELYLSGPHPDAAVGRGLGLMSHRLGLAEDLALRHLYVHRERHAVQHLLRVAAGLDSMILGEPQIQGQVRDAYAAAREAGADHPVVGPALNRLFQSALAAGGRVRSETGLGIGAASISSAAVELAKKIFGSLRGRRALVLGAGEMSEVTLECLRSEGVRSTIVANRTWDRARELADRWGGEAIRWESFAAALPQVDIVVCSTAAPLPVVTVERMRDALPNGVNRPLCILDIAVPRDVEPEVGNEAGVFLYDIDDLQQIVDDNLGRRRAELPAADAIVDQGVEDFWAWYSSLAVVPTIRALRDHGEQVRRDETERVLRQLAHLSEHDQQAVDALTRSILNKLLHTPTVRLRQAAGNGRGTGVLDTVRYLFHLDREHAASTDSDEPAE